MSKPRTILRTILRNVLTGRFTSPLEVKAHPDTTVTERERAYVVGDVLLVQTSNGFVRHVLALSPDGHPVLLDHPLDTA